VSTSPSPVRPSCDSSGGRRGANIRSAGSTACIHLSPVDTRSFPFSTAAPYQPAPQTVRRTLQPKFCPLRCESWIRAVIAAIPSLIRVSHRYPQYCFQHEPAKGFFKGTCLFDPLRPDTRGRMKALIDRNPGRLVALRIHEMQPAGTPPSTTGPIRDRDLRSEEICVGYVARGSRSRAAPSQMHFLPCYASQIGRTRSPIPGNARHS
jgi:hypothetical protein